MNAMRNAPLLTTLLATSLLPNLCPFHVWGGEAPEPAASDAARLVIVVSDPGAEWDTRQGAEEALAKLPARLVLPALVAHMPDQPAGVFYPPADSPAADKDAPPAWQAFYAARRVWKHQTSGEDRPAAELAPLLPDLLRAARTAEARAAVAALLATAWSDRAEEPLARLLRDVNEPATVRGRAAEALLAHHADRYRAEVSSVADAAPWLSPLKDALFFAMTAPDPSGAAPTRADPFAVMLGFQLMERHARTNEIEPSYACARRLEVYLDQRFRPAPSRPKYGPDPDADLSYRRETLDNAGRWWQRHGPAIRREVEKNRPRPA
jgi:hypothetical protein